jgi:hypothetical protein
MAGEVRSWESVAKTEVGIGYYGVLLHFSAVCLANQLGEGLGA